MPESQCPRTGAVPLPVGRVRRRCGAILSSFAEAVMPQVMDASRIERTLARIAHEILERNRDRLERRAGRHPHARCRIAERIAAVLRDAGGVTMPVGSLDITLYRDDFMRHPVGPQPVVRSTDIRFSVEGRAHPARGRRALHRPHDPGRARRDHRLRPAQGIQLIVLVDRGHRELPIKADYVGKNLPTSHEQSVQVRLTESTAATK